MWAIVFDLDGTLLDTLADIGNACNAILAKYDYPIHPIPDYRLMVGSGFTKLLERALPSANMPDAEKFGIMLAEAKAWYASHLEDSTRPYAGMNQALDILHNRGIKLAVLSNKPDDMSTKLIHDMFPQIPFASVQGARPDVPLKPDPTSLLKLLADMGATHAAYVGDSDVDMLTAKNAGVAAIGAAWGFRGAKELSKAGANVIANYPLELPQIVKELTLATA